jgi:hypothetical protein
MTDLKGFKDDLDFTADRLSSQVRAIALGLLAVTWAILIGESTIFKHLSAEIGQWLLRVGALSVLALLFDFLQYVFGYIYSDHLRKMLEARKLKDLDYNYRHPLWLLRRGMFWLKQATVLIAVIMFICTLIPYLFQAPTAVPTK